MCATIAFHQAVARFGDTPAAIHVCNHMHELECITGKGWKEVQRFVQKRHGVIKHQCFTHACVSAGLAPPSSYQTISWR